MKQPLLGVDDRAVHARYQPFVFRRLGPVGGRVLQSYLRTVEEEVELFGCVVLDLLVEVEQSAVGIANPSPSALSESDVVDGVFVVQTLVEVHQFVDVELAYLAQSRAARAAPFGMVERERLGIAHEGLPHTREEQPEQGCYVGVGSYCGTRVLRGLLLVDNNGYRQVVDGIDMRPPVLRQILLYESRKSVVELTTRLGGDGVEDKRALARPTDTGEHRNLILRDGERDILQIVLARSAYNNMV